MIAYSTAVGPSSDLRKRLIFSKERVIVSLVYVDSQIERFGLVRYQSRSSLILTLCHILTVGQYNDD